MGNVRFGFAVGVGFAAVAMPRRQQPDYFQAMPLVPGLALRIYWAKGRTKGIAQKCKKAPLRRGIAAAAKPTPAAKPKPHQRLALPTSAAMRSSTIFWADRCCLATIQ